MRNRRKRPSVLWLPPNAFGLLNPDTGGIDDSAAAFGTTISTSSLTAGSQFVVLGAPFADLPPDAVGTTSGQTVDSTQGNHYLLRRLVGKAFISLDPQATLTTRQRWHIGLGFFVARTADAESADAGLPIGASVSPQMNNSNYNPLTTGTAREPWLWRRTWMLDMIPTGANDAAYPRSTVGYGSVADGPHIDAKTKRRIENDERLFLAVGVSPQITPTPTEEADISVLLELRGLVSMVRHRQRGVF